MMQFFAQYYDYWRAGHILMIIAWMAGLLYLPRLFIYHFNAKPGGELESSLILQEVRLLRLIMNPAFILSWVFGILLVLSNAGRYGGWAGFLTVPWAIKFVLISLMTAMHHYYALARKKFAKGERPKTQKHWRIVNEVPAVLAIIIVLVATVWLR